MAVSRSSYTAPVRMSVKRFSSLIRPARDTLVTSVSQDGSSQPAHEKTRACLPRGPAVGAAGQGGGQGSSGRAAPGARQLRRGQTFRFSSTNPRSD
eukprot:COSAG01_NODE_6811_length_3487_cov_1.657910_3_plen_96_part_00